ncbi:hypothetical protein ABZP36_013255 [Zizania latifolia]
MDSASGGDGGSSSGSRKGTDKKKIATTGKKIAKPHERRRGDGIEKLEMIRTQNEMAERLQNLQNSLMQPPPIPAGTNSRGLVLNLQNYFRQPTPISAGTSRGSWQENAAKLPSVLQPRSPHHNLQNSLIRQPPPNLIPVGTDQRRVLENAAKLPSFLLPRSPHHNLQNSFIRHGSLNLIPAGTDQSRVLQENATTLPSILVPSWSTPPQPHNVNIGASSSSLPYYRPPHPLCAMANVQGYRGKGDMSSGQFQSTAIRPAGASEAASYPNPNNVLMPPPTNVMLPEQPHRQEVQYIDLESDEEEEAGHNKSVDQSTSKNSSDPEELDLELKL